VRLESRRLRVPLSATDSSSTCETNTAVVISQRRCVSARRVVVGVTHPIGGLRRQPGKLG
jgi:hypothetical protein